MNLQLPINNYIQMDACIKVHLSDAGRIRTSSLLVEISVSLPQKIPLVDEAECVFVKANKIKRLAAI